VALLKKDTAVAERLKRIRKELNLVDKDLRSLSSVVQRGDSRWAELPPLKSRAMRTSPGAVQTREAAVPHPVPPAAPVAGGGAAVPAQSGHPVKGGRDGRFADYLSASFQPLAAQGKDSRTHRKQALLVLVVFVLLLLVFVYEFMRA